MGFSTGSLGFLLEAALSPLDLMAAAITPFAVAKASKPRTSGIYEVARRSGTSSLFCYDTFPGFHRHLNNERICQPTIDLIAANNCQLLVIFCPRLGNGWARSSDRIRSIR